MIKMTPKATNKGLVRKLLRTINMSGSREAHLEGQKPLVKVSIMLEGDVQVFQKVEGENGNSRNDGLIPGYPTGGGTRSYSSWATNRTPSVSKLFPSQRFVVHSNHPVIRRSSLLS